MKLKFKQQGYQDEAVQSVVKCFEGQEKGSRKDLVGRYTRIVDAGTLLEKREDIELIAYGNHPITLTETERRTNIRNVQKENGINFTDKEPLSELTIEMETGTGKTYTYIKTMYELNKAYGWSKFIVIVPSIAIREGVQKSFEITQDHFLEEYHKKIRFFVYNSNNSSNIANINTFASDNSIQAMIINYQAFNSTSAANKRIDMELDELQSRKPIDVINKVNPILIIDEPQKIGEKTEQTLSKFKPLFTIRYSATHKRDFNKVYKLDAIDAYNKKLVKKISVKGIELLNNKSEGTYLFLDSVNISQKHDPEAMMEIDVKTNNGTARKLMKIKAGDNLEVKSGGLTAYKGYIVSEIDGRYDQYDKVFFTNGVEIEVGQAFGDIDDDQIIRIQIRETIRSHLQKEKELFKKGIKVLSLFFIDSVAKYKEYENGIPMKGKYAQWFEEEYQKAIIDYRTLGNDEYTQYLDNISFAKTHAGYFSVDKKKKDSNGESILIDNNKAIKKDSSGNYTSFDEDAYDLIMKDKERLLSLEEPVRFIFSHSALREGWDNPNIFQICTLKHSNSDISKRQEIGRGLRICVDNNGDRQDESVLDNNFHDVNTLTVIASESYDTFAKALQDDIYKSLSERPRIITMDYLKSKQYLINSLGQKLELNDINSMNIMLYLRNNGYVDDKCRVTENFIEAVNNNEMTFEGFSEFNEELISLVKTVYDTDNTKLVTNASKENIPDLIPNKNFYKEEFQDLWSKINIKTRYEVDFDSSELIEKAVDSINARLNYNKMKVVITEGSQKESINTTEVKTGDSMTTAKQKTEVVEDFSPSTVPYDLVGEITRDTGLTRKTIIEILLKISPLKFSIYKVNPEEFIRKVSKLINVQKASTVIEGITYHKVDQKYDNEIFTLNNVKAELGENAIDVKKHIYDFLKYDSVNEKKFAERLEAGDEVTVYAKLPGGFKIDTPMGSYNPDWAIVFDNPSFRYIYFIAETKGSMDSIELRQIEKAKIECARRHFASLSNDKVKYEMVDSYETLLNMIL